MKYGQNVLHQMLVEPNIYVNPGKIVEIYGKNNNKISTELQNQNFFLNDSFAYPAGSKISKNHSTPMKVPLMAKI